MYIIPRYSQFLFIVLALILLASPFMNIADIDAAQSSRDKACANPRDPGELDPKFCAHLIVIKNVVGGTASPSQFTIHVTAPYVSPSSFQGSSSGTTVTLGQGTYHVQETPVSDYTPDPSSDCSGSIMSGQTKICTITNTFTAPIQTAKLTVIKHVVGGTAQASDFQLVLSTGTAINGQCGALPNQVGFSGSEQGSPFTLPANTCYSVEENRLPDYFVAISGGCGSFLVGPVQPGGTYTCDVINSYIGP